MCEGLEERSDAVRERLGILADSHRPAPVDAQMLDGFATACTWRRQQGAPHAFQVLAEQSTAAPASTYRSFLAGACHQPARFVAAIA